MHCQCHTVIKLPSNNLCGNCYFKRTSFSNFGNHTFWREIKEMWYSKGGKCALSGINLTLGTDSELGHIKPLSRGGKNELDNVQWVFRVANRMKHNMTEEKLFSIIEKIYQTLKARKAISF